jgi:hypothetical protein
LDEVDCGRLTNENTDALKEMEKLSTLAKKKSKVLNFVIFKLIY